MRSFLILFFLFVYSFSFSQDISDELVKKYNANSYWTTLRLDTYLESGSFFYFENNNRFNLTNDEDRKQPEIGNTFPFSKFYRSYFLAGYEHKASDKWYLGLSEKFVINNFNKSLFSRINISHRGNFLKFRFIKEVALEHLNHFRKDFNIPNEGRVSFSPALIKELKGKERSLYIILAYRAYMLFDFNKDGFSAYDKRLIDKTRLRFELDYRVSDLLLVSVFAIRDTDYSYQLAQYDGSIPPVELVPEAKVNKITPTIGVGVNFILNTADDFIPGFPIK